MVVVAQLVEPQIVILVVAGSSPVDHPIFFQAETAVRDFLPNLQCKKCKLIAPRNVSLRVAITQLRLRSSMPHWRACKRAGRLRAVT